MTTSTIPPFATTVQKAHAWLKDLRQMGSFDDELQAYSVLRAVLHTLRDRLIVTEAAHLGAELPMLIRGLYFEGWKPAATPSTERHRDEFLDRVRQHLRFNVTVEPEQAVEATFRLLVDRISAGEVRDIKGMIPEELRELWPQTAASGQQS
jgi:uncharacterized protein (DUF2267 family)